MTAYRNHTFEQIEPGASLVVHHTVTRQEVELMALVSGEADPFAAEGDEAARCGPACEGVSAEALVHGMLKRQLPGPGTAILAHQLSYAGHASAGDELVASVTVLEKQAPDRVLRRHDVFGRLFRECEAQPAVRCAVVHPCDAASLGGALEAARQGLIEPVLVGPQGKIRAVALAEGWDLSPYRLVPTEHSHAAAEAAVALAKTGEVQALMKGSLHTDELMAAGCWAWPSPRWPSWRRSRPSTPRCRRPSTRPCCARWPTAARSPAGWSTGRWPSTTR